MKSMQLPAVLDLGAVKGLTAEILSSKGSDLAIDGTNVTRVGGLCVQVLLSAAATWNADGKKITYLMSDEFNRWLGHLGVDPVRLISKGRQQ